MRKCLGPNRYLFWWLWRRCPKTYIWISERISTFMSTLLKLVSMLLLSSFVYAKDVYKDPNGGNFVCNVRWNPPAQGKTEWTCPGSLGRLNQVEPGVNVVALADGGGVNCCSSAEWNDCVSKGYAGCCVDQRETKGLQGIRCCDLTPGGGAPNGLVYYRDTTGRAKTFSPKPGHLVTTKDGTPTSVPVGRQKVIGTAVGKGKPSK